MGTKLTAALSLIFLLLTGCKKASENSLQAVLLLSPLKGEICNTGVVISQNESQVLFEWQANADAESYELTYKNLTLGTSQTITSVLPKATVTLLRNAPYEWKVISKTSKSNKMGSSELWKFYNAGVGISSYVPYPADIVSPKRDVTVTPNSSSKVALSWKGEDPDNDIASYSIYFGTATTPPVYQPKLAAGIVTIEVTVARNTTYYWKVVTTDLKGNNADSGVYSFETN